MSLMQRIMSGKELNMMRPKRSKVGLINASYGLNNVILEMLGSNVTLLWKTSLDNVNLYEIIIVIYSLG